MKTPKKKITKIVKIHLVPDDTKAKEQEESSWFLKYFGELQFSPRYKITVEVI